MDEQREEREERVIPVCVDPAVSETEKGAREDTRVGFLSETGGMSNLCA